MSRRRTHNQFLKEVYELVGDEYTVVGTYTKLKTKIKMKHNKCDNTYEVTPNHFLHSGTRCPICFGKHKKTYDEFISELHDKCGDEYICLSKDYVNLKTKVKIKHLVCDHEYWVIPNNILNHNRRCPKCFGKFKFTQEEFIEKVKKVHGDDYKVISDHINNKTKVKIKHIPCNYEYWVSPSKILRGNRCPMCAKGSKGEERVKKFLEDNHLIFKKEFGFEDLKFINKLRFDFAIFDKFNNLKCLIEYDGIIHSKPWIHTNKSMEENIKDFEDYLLRDKMKNNYCVLNKIPLLRIPYTELLNIEDILKTFLKI